MLSSELLAEKIQSILGANYSVLPFHHFNQNYTTSKNTPQGLVFDIDYQAFKKENSGIMTVVTTTEPQLSSTDYVARSFNYTIQFSVPLDLFKKDADGILLETPKINFFADCKRLYDAVNAVELTFNDEYNESTGLYAKTYYGRMTMSEPTFSGKDTPTKAVYTINGNFNLYDTNVGTGAKKRICLVFKNAGGTYVEHFFNSNRISDVNVGSDTNANANQTSGALGAQLDTSNKSQNVSFTAVDIVSGTDLAMLCIYNKAIKNATVLSANEATARLQKKVRTRIYDGTTLVNDFWAVLSATWNADSETSYSSFSATLANDEKGVT